MQNVCRIVIGGDLCPTPKNQALFESGDAEALFGDKILSLFRGADVSVCNLEGALTDGKTPAQKCGPRIRSSKASAAGIRALGVTCVTLANNHFTDYGAQGCRDTCEALEEHGIAYFGAGGNENTVQPSYTVQKNGVTVTLYAVAETMFNRAGADTPGVNLYDEYRVCREIAELKSRCDRLIVLYHGGPEFFRYPSPELTKRFHRMADSGADLIVSQHSHAVGAREDRHGSVLIYGQGDFLLARHENEFTATGLLLEAEVSAETMTVTPHLLTHEGGTVRMDEKQDLRAFEQRSAQLSDDDLMRKEYRAFCDKKMLMYLEAFRGKRLTDKIVRRLLPRESYLRWLKKQYREDQILRTLHTIRCEEHSEQAIRGLLDMLEGQP